MLSLEAHYIEASASRMLGAAKKRREEPLQVSPRPLICWAPAFARRLRARTQMSPPEPAYYYPTHRE